MAAKLLCATALTFFGQAAWAQDQGSQAASEEEAASQANAIVVTGYRASLQSAIASKRTADVQMDEIKAEDIANFPDSNLAEAMQRLPGVSIDRDNGEGRQITVRGLGGDFNRTRLNGLEALSTAGSNDAGSSPNRSRAFDYNTFASELFSSLRVQKSSSAETDEGSLGATIDLTTGRPFDYAGTKIALSAQGSYNENSEKIDPRLAGLFSTRFLDGRMGFLVSGAYSKSSSNIDQYRRLVGSPDYLYRGTQWAGNENPQRAGFAAPTGTNFGSAITNPEAVALLSGSDPDAYAALYPGGSLNTPGRFNDSTVRIPALLSLEEREVRNNRLGLTAAWQWDITDRTRVSVDGVYSRFHNESTNYQIQSVGLNRNNTNTRFNTNSGTTAQKQSSYPGRCAAAAGDDFTPEQDCGAEMYGGALVPGYQFSFNPVNLDPWDYYNNPNSVGYTGATNGWGGFGELIGRPAVKVLDAHVTEAGLADYLVLQNVDWRSAADHANYTTKFRQGSINIDHEFTDTLRGSFVYGQSRSTNATQGLLVEFNLMDSQGLFVYDERDGGSMPTVDFGFDAADPSNWETVKGFSGIRHYQRYVKNTYEGFKADFDWEINPEISLAFGGTYRKFGFETSLGERNSDLLNPTLAEAGVTAASMGKVVNFGQGLNLPAGTATSFFVPTIEAFDNLFDFTCNCVNEWSDWRLTNKRNGGRENFGVSEEDLAFYFQFDFNSELFGRPFRGNAGTRVAITDLVSTGTTTAGRPVTGTNRYTDWLPSMNLNYEPIDDVMVRFAAAKVMARPLLGNLSPTITSISVPSAVGETTGASFTVGNPQLNPFRSTNLDASIEWYFGKGGLLSIAGFSKDISSFPQTVLYSAPLSQFGSAEMIEAIKAPFQAIVDNPGSSATAVQNALNQLAYIDADNPFAARQYRDAPGGWLRGFEISWQQDFTFLPGFLKNFGARLNYTYIDSELNYILDPGNGGSIPQTTGKGPFLGVSPHAVNGTLYYETKKFSTRVTGSWRKGYAETYPLASGSCSPGLVSVPASPAVEGTRCDSPLINDFGFRRSTFYVDAVITYKVTDNVTVRLEGINLTNQTDDRYAYANQNAVSLYASSGRVFRFGVRGSF